MTVTYIEQHCPYCDKDTSFQEFSSFTGTLKRCMECGYEVAELVEDYKIPTPLEIINS